MYSKFDLTDGNERIRTSEKYQVITGLTADVSEDEPSKLTGGNFGRDPKIVKCAPEEDERVIIVLLPKSCFRHVVFHCDLVYSMTILMGPSDMCVMFVLRVGADDAFAAFNQAGHIYEHDWHCFAWGKPEQTFTSEDEMELAMFGRVDTPD